LVQIVVSLKSTVGFVPNFKKIQFKRSKISFQEFSIIGFFARELHLLEVEWVDIVCFFSKFGQNSLFVEA
jgi:hypothetical protein